MKKLLCIALFSIAIMANAAEKKEIVANNSKEIKVEKVGDNTLTSIMFFGCSSDGNQIYDIEIANGATHREARATRRAARTPERKARTRAERKARRAERK